MYAGTQTQTHKHTITRSTNENLDLVLVQSVLTCEDMRGLTMDLVVQKNDRRNSRGTLRQKFNLNDI